ncbi:MAG TPA: hypothetical protein VKB05_21530 [Pyrinomonadaceae bacterium]|nr:hypothetical protein [Pyrinomonadaceae bacterium]
MKKLISLLMALVLLVQIAPAVLAKHKGDWNAVKALANSSVAVKTNTGETHYGLMRSADDSSITVQIADHDDFTPQEISFRRDEVAKLWRARLRFGQKNIAKGAWLGAGAGLGAGYIAALIQSAKDSGDPFVGGGLFIIYGAVAGAFLGRFWKKSHKKQDLVYST